MAEYRAREGLDQASVGCGGINDNTVVCSDVNKTLDMFVVTLRAKLSGAVCCYRSCHRSSPNGVYRCR